MSTSGTYNFGSVQNEQIITDAFERIGIKPGLIVQEDIDTALRSMNFILSSWINKGLNLWTVKTGLIALTNNQFAYALPVNLSTMLFATIRTSVRNLGGVAASSAGGIAANAFDGNANTACIQTAPNGNISYNWNQGQFGISMVGIQSNLAQNYSLVAEYSYDGINWFTSLAIDTQFYPFGIIQWFTIPIPTVAPWYRIREEGGATLNIQELFFNSQQQDTVMTAASWSEYDSYPLKNQTGRPANFFLDRQISPVVYLWPTPNTQYNCMYYRWTRAIQDAGSMLNGPEIPDRFLEALTAKVAHILSVKRVSDINKINMLDGLAEREYTNAGIEDRERVPFRAYGDYQGYNI